MNVVGLLQARNTRDDFDAVTSKWGHKIGVVDLGTLVWRLQSTSGRFAAQLASAKVASSGAVFNGICSLFVAKSFNNVYEERSDNSICINTNNDVYVFCSAYSDVAAFKAAMSGVLLFFELAEPWEETVTPQPITLQKGYNSLRQIDGSLANTEADAKYYGVGGGSLAEV